MRKYNRWANFDPALGKSVLAGTPGYPRALMDTHYRNFSPRLGLAWRVTPNTVARGGYGIFYGFDLQYTMYRFLGATAYPFTQIQLYQAPRAGLLTLADPFPSTFAGKAPGATSPNGWDMQNPTEYMQDWNITISHELSQSLGFDISYVGTKGTHENQLSNLDQWIRTAAGNIVPYPGLSQVLYENLGANSIYNALQVSLRKRFSNGVSFRSNFSWSKSIDDASFGTVQPQNSRDLPAERGLSSFNRAYTWSNDLVYELPFGRGHRFGGHLSRAEDLLLGGWQINGLMEVYSGLPFTPTVSKSNIQQGFATRPDRLASGTVPNPTINGWFDPAAFAVVPPTDYRFGNSGRDILTGPGAVMLDSSLFKEFAMPGETHILQFRAEFFNAMNHPVFGLPPRPSTSPPPGSSTAPDRAARSSSP